MNTGWICLHRKILEWEWFDDAYTFKVFVCCLIFANNQDEKWHGVIIKKGQFVTSLKTMSDTLNLTIQRLKTCLKRLENSGEISQKSTNKYRIITICKYDSYQNDCQVYQQTTNKQLTNKQQTNNKQSTTNNKYIYNTTTVSSDTKVSSDPSVVRQNDNVSTQCFDGFETQEKQNDDSEKIPISDVEKRQRKDDASKCNDIIKYWNDIFTGTKVLSVRKLTKKRKDKLMLRIRENDFETLKRAIDVAKTSKFLLGIKSEDQKWRMNFDWFIANDTNVISILEGKYDNDDTYASTITAGTNGLSQGFVNMLKKQYTIVGDDGQMYPTVADAKAHRNSMNDKIQEELQRQNR